MACSGGALLVPTGAAPIQPPQQTSHATNGSRSVHQAGAAPGPRRQAMKGPAAGATSSGPSLRTLPTSAPTCSRSCVSRGWAPPTGGPSWPSASGSSCARSGEVTGPGPGRERSRCWCRCGGRAGSRDVVPWTSSVNPCGARRWPWPCPH